MISMMCVRYLLLAAAFGLAGCNPAGLPQMVSSPEPGLSFLGQYTGKLSEDGGCVILVTGASAMRSGKSDDNDKALLIFARGFSIESAGTSWRIVSPEGARHAMGSLVTGKGGPYPSKAKNPGAPFKPASGPGSCPSRIIIQANSMQALEPTLAR